jgi:hypothetical protein
MAKNSYVEMAMKVMDAALKMEAEAKKVAAQIAECAGRQRTKTEQRGLTSLYSRMDKLELGLKRCLNP